MLPETAFLLGAEGVGLGAEDGAGEDRWPHAPRKGTATLGTLTPMPWGSWWQQGLGSCSDCAGGCLCCGLEFCCLGFSVIATLDVIYFFFPK